MVPKRLYLIDATAFCYRAFYALPGLSTSSGQPTNAIYGFTNILKKIIEDHQPDYLAACFDISRKTFRQDKFKEYKIQRPEMPDPLKSQIPFIKDIVKAMGVKIFEKEGLEADDLIAHIAKLAKKKGIVSTIVSSDKDMLQLVDEDTFVFSPYKDSGTLYDKAKVLERYGIAPEQIPDVLSLMGDAADNLPGVPGVGEKTAVDLIKQFGSAQKLIEKVDSLKKEKLKESIKHNTQTILLVRELSFLNQPVELEFDFDDLSLGKEDKKELAEIFRKLEFKKFLKGLLAAEGQVAEGQALKDLPVLSCEEIAKLLRKDPELILSVAPDSKFSFLCAGQAFVVSDIAQIKNALEDSKIKKSGHDLKNLKLALSKEGIFLQGINFDTMLACYVLNPAESGYSLEDLSLEYLGSNPQGVETVFLLKDRLRRDLEEKSLLDLFYKIEMPLVEVLSSMEITGIKIDKRFLKILSGKIDGKLEKLIAGIYKVSGREFNINSPKQLGEVLFQELKLPIVKKTKTGPSTDEEVLTRLALEHELPKMLLEYRQLVKLKNTYVDVLPELADANDFVHTSFNQTGTETGRLSSSSPNLQNIPIKTELGSQVRKAIVCFDKESVLVSFDYSQIELRVLAHLCADKTLTDAFLSGKDVHKITASLIYDTLEEKVDSSMRDVAKRINFGIIYGLSSWGLSKDLHIPVEKAQNFIDAYFSRYPGVKDYIDKQIALAQTQGFVTTLLGRRRYLPQINDKNQGLRFFAQRQAVNTPVQGTASDLMKLAMIDIHKEISSRNFNSKMILQIHDELVFNTAKEDLKRNFVDLIRQKMEAALKLDVPLVVSVKSGNNWLEMEAAK
ncbi:MAG: DNA polymerase I [Candidatus Omnitrophica bacterium]|jgi:DNA polymerase-1|nr:DNA polymerase I [Candidatus Omnitrophota bacterium]